MAGTDEAGSEGGQMEASTSGQTSSGQTVHRRHLRVGCALLPKKVARYLTPHMLATAAAQGIELCLIDYHLPLQEQGIFDGIVHKLRPDKDWERNLLEYCRQHPEVTVIDHVDGIRTLQNRSTMLSPLKGDGILVKPSTSPDMPAWEPGHPTGVRVQAPVQVEITETTTLGEAQQLLQAAGLRPPLLVKPLWSDGREGSHGLAVLHDLKMLEKLLSGHISSELKPPLVVQQFVEHGGVLYKVYVLGTRSMVSTRPSLGDSYLGHEARRRGVLQLPRISCKSMYGSPEMSHLAQLLSTSTGSVPAAVAAATAFSVGGSTGGLGAVHKSASEPQLAPLPPRPHLRGPPGGPGDVAHAGYSPDAASDASDLPPEWVTHTLASVLRKRLGLQLFNFDLIIPETQAPGGERLYYVIDINYFPGVDKIPNFESVFVDFLRSACTGEPQQPQLSQRQQQQAV